MMKYYCIIDSDGDEVTLVIETADVLSKQSILLLNCAWYGLSLMFLLMSVEGKYISSIILTQISKHRFILVKKKD